MREAVAGRPSDCHPFKLADGPAARCPAHRLAVVQNELMSGGEGEGDEDELYEDVMERAPSGGGSRGGSARQRSGGR